MNKSLPLPGEARNELLNKLQENIKKKIKLLESAIDTYVKDAEYRGDNNDGVPLVDKKKLDNMAAEIEELRKKIKGGGRRTRRRRRKKKRKKSRKKRKKRRRRTRK
jgi:hypothetical protein